MREGDSIGQYCVVRKIGEGGMGAVYLAEHILIGRQAAIKVLLPELSQRRDIVDRFFNEARATTAVSDPGIVQVFDFGFHTDGSAFIVMEFLEGEPLDVRLERLRSVPTAEALRIIRQVCASLAAAHARGIVHRDLKPANIFMVRDLEAPYGERPKLLDFGIAKLSGGEPARTRTQTGALIGTPIYMSPEQCRGVGTLDHRSDIYSLGCVLYHLITGRPPFDLEGIGEIIGAHLHASVLPPSTWAPALPRGVDELLMHCLEKAPEQRFQSMQELHTAVEVLLARITSPGETAPNGPIAVPLAPGFRSGAPTAATSPQRTTLTSATGQHSGHSVTRRSGVWIGLGAGVVAGVIAFAVSRSPKSTATEPKPTASPQAALTRPLTPVVDAAIAAPDALAAIPVPDAAVAEPDAAVVKSHVKPKPTTKPKPTDDMYDDR